MPALQVVSLEAAPLKHVRDRSTGIAVCGEPAKLENIIPWGGDHNCETCARLYGQRVRGAAS